jgi:phosphoglycolate phosphatase
MKDLRILLWDIDGTLLRSRRPESFKDYTIPLLERVFGTSGKLAGMRVSGMTDLQIIGEALSDEGISPEYIRSRLDEVRSIYLEEMHRVATGEEYFELLPGVEDALRAADEDPRFHNALLTGNMEPAARLKLRLVNLDRYFNLPGAFGDDSHDRRDLPALAAERISRHLGLSLTPEQFIVIGDTPNDIACAQHFGAKVMAVGTGRGQKLEELAALNPNVLVPDLCKTKRFIECLSRL